MTERGDDEPPRQRRFAEPHLGLRRVDVHIHPLRVAVEEQGRRRVPVAAEKIGVGGAEGAGQQPVGHGTPVDEKELLARRTARIGRQGGPAGQAQALPLRFDPERVFGEFRTEDAAEAPEARVEQIALFGFGAESRSRRALGHIRKGEGDARRRHGEAFQGFGNRLRLSFLSFQKFQTRGCGVEKIAQLHLRPRSAGGGSGRIQGATPRLDHPGAVRPGGPARHLHPPDRGHRRQRLPPETECADVQQVRAVDLRGRVAFKRQRQLRRRHARTVVGNPYQRLAAIGDGDVDPPRPGVQRVLNQLFHRCRRTFDHLARSDAVRGGGGEAADARFSRYMGVGRVHAPRDSMERSDSTSREHVIAAE